MKKLGLVDLNEVNCCMRREVAYKAHNPSRKSPKGWSRVEEAGS